MRPNDHAMNEVLRAAEALLAAREDEMLKGLVVECDDGAEFQVSIVKGK